MKKVFENPTMGISLFCPNDAVTTASGKVYEQSVRDALTTTNGVTEGNLTEAKFTDIFGLTF